MSLFKNVQSQKVTSESTAEYDLFEIGMPEGKLTVRPATRSNKAYFSSLFRMGKGLQRRIASGNLTPELADKVREAQKPLYAKHVIAGWSKVMGVDETTGEPVEVPFSESNCLDLLNALPNHIMDGLVEFCENDTNFSDDADIDVGELGNV